MSVSLVTASLLLPLGLLSARGEIRLQNNSCAVALGLDYGRWTLTCILTNPFNNQLEFRRSPDQALVARLTHQFTRNHPVKESSMPMAASGAGLSKRASC